MMIVLFAYGTVILYVGMLLLLVISILRGE